MMDPFEYFRARMRDDLFKTEFNSKPGNVSYHVVVIYECKMLVRKLERFLRKYLVVQLTQLKDAPVMRAHGESRKSFMRLL